MFGPAVNRVSELLGLAGRSSGKKLPFFRNKFLSVTEAWRMRPVLAGSQVVKTAVLWRDWHRGC